MTTRQILTNLMRVISDEIERNPAFEARILGALGLDRLEQEGRKPRSQTMAGNPGRLKEAGLPASRPSNRRPPAVLDPVEVAREGEEVLRKRLSQLTIDQLRDIVAEFGMDTGKLVLKWKVPERIVDRIVEIAVARSKKGNAFRD